MLSVAQVAATGSVQCLSGCRDAIMLAYKVAKKSKPLPSYHKTVLKSIIRQSIFCIFAHKI